MVNKNYRFKFIQILSIKTISPCFLTTINRKTPIYEDLRVNFALNMHREQKMCKHDVSSFFCIHLFTIAARLLFDLGVNFRS